MPTRETLIDVLPFLILWSLCAGIGIAIGKRKGVGVPLAILGSFPLWVAVFAFWRDRALLPIADWPEAVQTLAAPTMSSFPLADTVAGAVEQTNGIRSLI